LLLLILRVICGIEAHRQSFVPMLLPPARVHSSRAAKQNEWWEKIIFWLCYSFFTHSFFQLSCCLKFSCASCGIEAHRPSFVTQLPPPTCVHFSRVAAQKDRWEKIICWWYYSFFTHQFFN
jgi:hypothetical protein